MILSEFSQKLNFVKKFYNKKFIFLFYLINQKMELYNNAFF